MTKPCTSIAIALVLCWAAAAGQSAGPSRDRSHPPVDVVIAVGDTIDAYFALYRPGTTFAFAPGVHRLREPIVPRDGDTFVGQPGAVLTGARVLDGFREEGGMWSVAAPARPQRPHGSCRSYAPRCGHPEDVFIDEVPQRHVASRDEVGPGTWFYDLDANRVYIGVDPVGRRVEMSVTTGAFVGDANGVGIINLTIEKFAAPAQRAAIFAEVRPPEGSTTYGQDWRIEGNVVRHVHGVGIRAGGGARIVENVVVDNGQLGIASVGPGATVVIGNEIARNNYAGFHARWEAGGTKFLRTDGLVVRDNYVHHNLGPGLWTDSDNIDTLYEGNLVEYNTDTGIFHEISYRAVIRNNVVRFNGFDPRSTSYRYVFGSGILVFNSPDVEVYGNTVVGNWNGINGLQQERGTGAHGPYELRNLHVHGNHVEKAFHPDAVGPQGERGVMAVSGVSQAGGFREVFSQAYNNRFEKNVYVIEDRSLRAFTWLDVRRDFVAWQACGGGGGMWDGCTQDADGELIVGTPQRMTQRGDAQVR